MEKRSQREQEALVNPYHLSVSSSNHASFMLVIRVLGKHSGGFL